MEVARSRGIRVMLTGNGGDEWLGVTPFLASDLIRAGDIVGLLGLYWSSVRSFHRSPIHCARNIFWSYGLRPILKDAAFRYLPRWAARQRRPGELPHWLAPDPELRRRLSERLQPPPLQPVSGSVYVRDLNDMIQHWVVTWVLEEFYYRSHGRGITYFHPYWSRPLAEFLLRVPPSLLNEGGRSKGMARRMLAERFPGLGFERQKKYVDRSGYYAQTVAHQWSGIWRQYAPDSALARAGIVDAPGLEQAMQAAAANTHRAGCVAQWLSTEAWLRAHQ
jgi:asparagine synthase (glutamine-hydrolysing)